MGITEGNINGLKRVILRGMFMYICMLCANMDIPVKYNRGTFSAPWLPCKVVL